MRVLIVQQQAVTTQSQRYSKFRRKIQYLVTHPIVTKICLIILSIFKLQYTIFILKMQEPQLYNQSLIPKSETYDPFMNPPNFQLAEKHQKATSVGVSYSSPLHSQRCPCCQHIIQKKSLPLYCNEEDLSFLGVAHPLYFRLAKYYALIVFVIFIISGGAWNMYTGLSCLNDSCERFLWIGIYDPSAVSINQWTHVITCIAITLFIMYLKPKIQQDIDIYKTYLVCPSQYTFMLQNLPQTINEGALSHWVQNLIGEKPIKINLSYDLTVHQSAYQKKQELIFKLNQLKIQGEQLQLSVPFRGQNMEKIQSKIEKVNKELEAIDKTLQEFNTQQNPPIPTGTAFVTLDSKQKVRQVVDTFGDSFLKSFTNCLFGYIKSPYPLYGKYYVLVSQAPSPRDVIWQNLLFSFVRNFMFSIVSLIIMGVIIVLAFRLQGYFVNYAYELRRQGVKTGKLINILESLSMSGIVVVVNIILRLIIQQFSRAQKYYSYTKFNSSFANSYFLLYFFNSALTVYIVHGNLAQPSNQLLLWDIHVIIIANAFSEPLSRILDPTMYWRYFQRYRIRRQKPTAHIQKYVNSLWQGHSLCMADNYAYINRILFISTWFGMAAPLGSIISLVGLLITYWIDKIFLLRVNKIPESMSAEMASKFLVGLQALPLIYLCGTLQFTYNISTSANLIEFLWQFLSHGVVLLVFLISVIAYFGIWKQKQQKPLQAHYREVEYHFKYEYDTQNPITRYNAQLQFLRKVLNNVDLDPQSSRKIEQLLQKSMYQNHDMDQSRLLQIQQIKSKMIKQSSKGPSQMQSMYSSKRSQQ